jgi:hypothetical protein
MSSLFQPIQAALDPKYLLARDDPRFHKEKLFLENLWDKFAPFADSDFGNQLALQFHPRFWEMYLASTFIEMGFDLVPHTSAYGPDIQINLKGKNLWIEAIAPDAGNGDDAVPMPQIYTGGDVEWMRVPEEQIILRLTNAFYKKCQKYQGYVSSGLIAKNDIYVIAVNGFDIPYAFGEDEIPYIVKSVFPFGNLTISLDMKDMKPVDEFYTYRGYIQKKSGANVPTIGFQNPSYSFVSGVLYSISELWNLPVSQGNDFLFIHNPLADQKLEKGWIGRGKSFWVEGDQLRFTKNSENI